MSRKNMRKAVIRYLEERHYRFQRFLGAGGFADVIAVVDPAGREAAIKIIEKKDIWPVEDQYWPSFHHPNVLEVYDVLTVEKLNVKLYVMPLLPQTLDDILESKNFRNNPQSLNRMKKWSLQILSALQYLHSNGFVHLDLKADNILIDQDDNAILADFSGLNVSKWPIDRFVSPTVFRPPECFDNLSQKEVRAQDVDRWIYSIFLLNVFTGHYYTRKATRVSSCFMNWSTHLWPIIQKATTETKFRRLMKRAFPKASLPDIQLALQFVKFLMRIDASDRPDASRVKQHLFLKLSSNPFLQDQYDRLHQVSPTSNPFKKVQNVVGVDPLREGDVPSSQILAQKDSSELHPEKGSPRRRRTGKNIKNWFVKQLNRAFK